MKAIIYNSYGSPNVLKVAEINKPTPKDNEILIKIHASAATTGDVNMRGFVFVPKGFKKLARLAFGWKSPKKQVLGVVFAGEIEAIGKDIKRFKEKDQVYGIDSTGLGAYAEYSCKPESRAITIKPSNVSFEEAASVPFGAHTALYFLRDKAKIKKGEKILINGAAGAIGTYAIQFAKYFGAEVTAVCSRSKIEYVKSLGADKVIDYTKDDFTKEGITYDHILDTVGNLQFSKCKKSLVKKGNFLAPAAKLTELLKMLWTSIIGGKKLIGGSPSEKSEPLEFIKGLIESGKIKPVVDNVFPLIHTADAHRYVDKGHKKGSVIIKVVSK